MQVELVSITPDAERLIERAGRTCYMSHNRIKEDSAPRFLRMLISRGHLSVLEHASATFHVSGISRAATHQLVRHRLCSFSQKSQRYVLESEPSFVIPPSIQANPECRALFDSITVASKQTYRDLVELGIPKEDARFVMPNAAPSEIVISANFRELRHIISVRGSRHAQWEVRELAAGILRIMKGQAPNVFFDLEIKDDNCVERILPEVE
jgi:thymidylate synthase (FAD)